MKLYKKILLPLLLGIVLMAGIVLGTSCKDDKPNSNTYTVTYVFDNGEPNKKTTVKKGELAVEPNDPEKDGYTFEGWLLEDEFYDFSTPVTANIKLYASWEKVGGGNSSSGKKETARITWKLLATDEQAYKFLFDEEVAPKTVDVGTEVSFRIWTSPFYTGTATVMAGKQEVQADADGYYTFTVQANTTFSVAGLKHDDVKLDGWGTPQNPYVIRRAAQLENVIKAINTVGNTKFNSATFVLDADLDLKGATIDPIGCSLDDTSTIFKGTFNGNDHTISNFKINEEYGVVALFGNVMNAEITQLHIVNDYQVDMRQEANYLVGGVAGYSIGSDILGCTFNGSITTNNSFERASIFVGGIVAFAQGYTEHVSNVIAYCNVNATFSANGTKEIFAAGGILGSGIGTSESAPALVSHCTYNGNIEGKHNMSGGIVGYLREFSSVSNCFTSGTYVGKSNSSLAAAGGIVGLADNETVVSYCYSMAETQAEGSQDGIDNFITSADSTVGLKYKNGSEINGLVLSVDGRSAYEYKCYKTQDGKVTVGGSTYDLTTMEGVQSLFGWTEKEWDIENKKPVAAIKEGATVSFTINVSFKGEQVELEDEDGNKVTVSEREYILDGYTPLNWVLGGTGQNTFTSLGGKISYGFFFDEECTERIPSSMLLTNNMNVYVGFADYSVAEGEYEVVVGVPRTLTEYDYHYAKLIFDANGKVIIEMEGMRAAYVYVYNGEYILIRGAYFANLLYTTNSNTQYETDFYLKAADGEAFNESNELILHDNVFFSSSNKAEYAKPIRVYRPTPALGVWYEANGGTIEFKSDYTGVWNKQSPKEEIPFTYEYFNGNVIITCRNEAYFFTLSADNTVMTQSTSDLIFDKANRFDDFAGTWETSFEKNIKVTFDGKSKVEYKGTTYDYTITDGVLSFAGVTAKFDEYGLMEITENGETLVYGKEGSFIGIWTETMHKYEVRFDGIGKFGYGYALDTQGVPFTYTSELVSKNGEQYYHLEFYYRTMVYGYADSVKATYEGNSEISSPALALAVFSSKQSVIVDDYNMTYKDAYLGTWNSTERSLEFNGFGLYNINYSGVEGNWKAKGEVTVTEGETETIGTYYYDYKNAKAIVTIGDKTYEATLVEGGVRLVGNGEDKVYIPSDILGDQKYQGDDVLIQFNGKGNVNDGKATLTLKDGVAVEYTYVLEGKVATLSLNGEAKYTATINDETRKLELQTIGSEETVSLGLFSNMSGKAYVTGSTDEYALYIDGYFDLDGNAKGSINGTEVDFIYTNENQAGLYYNGELIYILLYNEETSIILYDGNLNPLTILTTADEWRGTYVNGNGDTVTIDGRGLMGKYGSYGTLHFETDGKEYYYVYLIHEDEETGEVMLNVFELDRTEEEDVPIKRYRITKTETKDAIAYEMDGTIIYVIAESAE